MFCQNCGNKLSDEDRFCTKCGAKVDINVNETKVEKEDKEEKIELKKVMPTLVKEKAVSHKPEEVNSKVVINKETNESIDDVNAVGEDSVESNKKQKKELPIISAFKKMIAEFSEQDLDKPVWSLGIVKILIIIAIIFVILTVAFMVIYSGIIGAAVVK